jgi:hypothetical protein
MSEFLEHKKTIDPKVWIDKIPPQWRMPVALGGPALLIICMIPLLFREDKAKGIDRNTVSHLATDIRSEEHAKAAHEAQLSAALEARLKADAPPASSVGQTYGSASASGAAPSGPGGMAAPPGFDALANAGANGSASGGGSSDAGSGGDQPLDQPHLQKTGPSAAGVDAAGGSGGAVKATPKGSAGTVAQAAKPMAKPGLKAFTWSGAGHGAGNLGGGHSAGAGFGSVAAGLSGGANTVQGSSQFSQGSSASGSGGAGGGSSGSGSGSAASTMGSGAGTSGAGSGGAPNFGAQTAAIQACMDAQNKYNPIIKDKQSAMKSEIDYRTNHSCKDTGCYNCTGNESWYNNPIYISWRNWFCPCAAARCRAQSDCNTINTDTCDISKACPGGGACKSMDCSMSGK